MRVLLYSSADCGLCDAFHYELLDLQDELGFAYEKRQLAPGDALFAEFRGLFPVVDIHADGLPDSPLRLTALVSQPHLRTQLRQAARASAVALDE